MDHPSAGLAETPGAGGRQMPLETRVERASLAVEGKELEGPQILTGKSTTKVAKALRGHGKWRMSRQMGWALM